jgi:hypothetical protein
MGEAEEGGRHIFGGRGAADASLAVRFSEDFSHDIHVSRQLAVSNFAGTRWRRRGISTADHGPEFAK